MARPANRLNSLTLLYVALLVAPGCSRGDLPPLGTVTGTVKVNGVPLTGAIILFMPEKGRTSTSLTDKDGKYNLQYSADEPGCKVGPNSVAFEVPIAGGASHPIPAKYAKDGFKVDVKKGRNTFNFDLEPDAAPAPIAAAPAKDAEPATEPGTPKTFPTLD